MNIKENKIISFSIIISFLFHFFLIYLGPKFENKKYEDEKKYEITKINTRFVKLKEDVQEKIIPKKNEKKTQVKTVNTGEKTEKKISKKIEIVGEKIEINRNFIEINAINDKVINDYKLPPLPKEEDKFLFQNYNSEKESFEGESFEIKEDTLKNGFDDLEKNPIKIVDEEIEEDLYTTSLNIGVISEGGASETELPEGIEVDVADGMGIAVWDNSNANIQYPLEAEKNAWEGVVTVKLTVDEGGQVRNVESVKKSGYFILDRAVEKTAKNWKIYIKKDGIKISGTVYVTRTFYIGGR